MQSSDGGIALSLAFLCTSLFFLLWLTCRAIDEFFSQREKALADMRRFGEAFIREFERPLVQQPFLVSPIRTRLRTRPDRGRLEVFLAPNGRLRYPNLSDHRKNVAYDVARVLQTLHDQSFVCGELSACGEWVVVSFQLQRQVRRNVICAQPPQRTGGP